jgi:hypothetical protein
MMIKRFHETLKQKWGQNPVRAQREAGALASRKRGNAVALANRGGAILRGFVACFLIASVSGCTISDGDGFASGLATARANLTPVQECAISYDLAVNIHKVISPRGTTIYARKAQSSCEARTLEYLRQSGFAIDQTTAKPPFKISIHRVNFDTVHVSANVADGYVVSRSYQPVEQGVIPLAGISVMNVPSSVRVHYEDRQ